MILSRPIGIDLGTTNSAVGMLDPNERDLVLARDAQGRTTTPSCVWWDARQKQVVVGHKAYARRGARPEPISSIKRSMGTQMTVDLGGVPHTPAQISACILGDLKAQMEAELARAKEGTSYDVSRAIVTVPAYFGLPAIEATREAGQIAGLEVAELLHEPTAAAIYYSWKHRLGDGIYMVYDLGGGTFDVSILRRTAGEFLVLGISGDNFLGGDDFDRRLAEHLRGLLVAEGYDLNLDVGGDADDRVRFNQLVALAERAKKQLSDQEEIVFRDQGTLQDKSGAPVVIEATLARATFEALIGDLIDRTISACQVALDRARERSGVTLDQIDHILLVGGSTYVPAVAARIGQAFCAPDMATRAKAAAPIRDDPETAVALGAALRAAAAGLGVGDDQRRVRVWFRGGGATRREETTVAGHVEVLAPGVTLDGGALRLASAGGEALGSVELKPGLRFTFPEVPLTAESHNAFRFDVFDASGTRVATVERGIVQSAEERDTVGRALSTAVLSKPIVMEGTDGDRLLRTVLLAEGTSLPATAHFTFATADDSGFVRLPIYQESRVIKELEATVGRVPAGTPVDVEISCDEQVRIHVQFRVGGQAFGGRIEPPPPDAVPTEFDVERIDQRFGAVLETLDAGDRTRLESAYAQARHDLEEARRGADYPKVIQRAADLEGLVREARLLEPLRPSIESLEQQVASCLDMMPKAAAIKADLAPPRLKADLEAVLERARVAYARRDRHTYEDATQAVGAALEFLASVTRARIADNEQMDVRVRAAMALQQAKQMLQFLFVTCLFTGKSEFFDDVRRYLAETEDLAKQAGEDPIATLNRAQVLITEARRIFPQVVPQEKRDAALDGLLKVGGQGLPGVEAARGLFGDSKG